MSRSSSNGRSSPKNWVQWALFGFGGLFLFSSIIILVGVPAPLGDFVADNANTTATPRTTVASSEHPDTEETPVSTATAKTKTTSPTPKQTDAVAYRINVGGPRLEARDDGPDWLADRANAPSTYLNYRVSDTVANDTPDAITTENTVPPRVPKRMFKSYRFERGANAGPSKPMVWEFPVDPNHNYEVRIYVMEPYFTKGESGRPSEEPYSEGGPRTFGIAIENEVVLKNYEPFVEHGHDVGAVKSFDVIVKDGTLTIRFLRKMENPTVSGIEIVDTGPRGGNN